MQVGLIASRPQYELEDIVNLFLGPVTKIITDLDKIGVKLYIIEVAESEFHIHFKKYSLKSPKSFLEKKCNQQLTVPKKECLLFQKGISAFFWRETNASKEIQISHKRCDT